MPVIMIMEGTRPNAYNSGGHPAPDGANPTQPFNAVKMFKIKTALSLILILTLKY